MIALRASSTSHRRPSISWFRFSRERCSSTYDYETTLARLATRYRAESPVRVFYQVWDRPLMTAGGAELTNDLIELCGGINVFGELSALAPKVNLEAVLLRDGPVQSLLSEGPCSANGLIGSLDTSRWFYSGAVPLSLSGEFRQWCDWWRGRTRIDCDWVPSSSRGHHSPK